MLAIYNTDFNNPSNLKLLDITGRIDTRAKSALQIWNNFLLLTRIHFFWANIHFLKCFSLFYCLSLTSGRNV